MSKEERKWFGIFHRHTWSRWRKVKTEKKVNVSPLPIALPLWRKLVQSERVRHCKTCLIEQREWL